MKEQDWASKFHKPLGSTGRVENQYTYSLMHLKRYCSKLRVKLSQGHRQDCPSVNPEPVPEFLRGGSERLMLSGTSRRSLC